MSRLVSFVNNFFDRKPVDRGAEPLPVRETMDVLNERQIYELVTNIELRRQFFMDMFLDRRRNIDKECGYPATVELNPQVYHNLYERDPVAARVVDIYPDECWQVTPELYETEDEGDTPFEVAFNELGKALTQGSKWKDDNNNPIWQYLHRADKLCGVGRYGAILLGVDDGGDLSEPLEPGQAKVLNFMRVLDEQGCLIASAESDETNERYGKPDKYQINLTVPSQLIDVSIKTADVHWTRVVHIADNLQADDVLGIPRMQRAYNRLYDLHKLYGGSAEMYWLGALPPIAFQTHPQLGGQVRIDKADMKNQLEALFNSLQRYVALPGMEANQLAPVVVDPTPQIDCAIEALCVFLGVPKRIFVGSERGELASSQDLRQWYGRCKRRQEEFITPSLIVPFIDRLIWLGILPEPQEYFVHWPDISTVTDQEEAQVGLTRTQMLAEYAASDIPLILTPRDYLIRIAKFEPSEADEMLENAQEAVMEAGATQQEQQFDENGMPIEQPPMLQQMMGGEGAEGVTGTAMGQGATGTGGNGETGTGGSGPTGTGGDSGGGKPSFGRSPSAKDEEEEEEDEVDNVENADGVWRTIRGNRVFIKENPDYVSAKDDPTLYGKKDYEIPGDKRLADGGAPIRGTVISPDDPRIPQTLYHMSTNKPAVEKSGYLRASGEGGLGGDKADRIVSLTADKDIAEQITKDTIATAKALQANKDVPPYSWNDTTIEWVGDRTRWAKKFLGDLGKETGWKDYQPHELQLKSYTADDHVRSFFSAREAKVGTLNPLFYDASKSLGNLDVSKVGVVTVSKSALKSGAMVTDFDLDNPYGLKEIRVYGNVKIADRVENAEGVWRTIRGAKVFIEDGKITKGPKALVGLKDWQALSKMQKKDKEAREADQKDPYKSEFENVSVVKGGDELPKKLVDKLKKSEDIHRVVFDTKTDTWHINEVGMESGSSNHAEFSPTASNFDTEIVRGLYSPSDNSLTLYDLKETADQIAGDNGLSVQRVTKLLDDNLETAYEKLFTVGGTHPTAETADLDDLIGNAEGVWRTIRGAKVFIEDGKITKGPKALVGRSEAAAEAVDKDVDSIQKMAPGAIKRLERESPKDISDERMVEIEKHQPTWTTLDGIEVLKSPNSRYVAAPESGKKNSATWLIIDPEDRSEAVAILKKSEVNGWLAKRSMDPDSP